MGVHRIRRLQRPFVPAAEAADGGAVSAQSLAERRRQQLESDSPLSFSCFLGGVLRDMQMHPQSALLAPRPHLLLVLLLLVNSVCCQTTSGGFGWWWQQLSRRGPETIGNRGETPGEHDSLASF